jgi:hypothetical protein
MENESEIIGYIKYDGERVAPGVLDAGQASGALDGLNTLLRHFNAKQAPALREAEYEVPVRIGDGSWLAYVAAGAGVVTTAYLGTAAKKMAERDFEGFGLSDIFRQSMDGLRCLIRLTKHTRKPRGWSFSNLRWRKNNTEVGIENDQGDIEWLPAEYLKWFENPPNNAVRKLVEVVEEERELRVGVQSESGVEEESVGVADKGLFASEDSANEEYFVVEPELQHGDQVALEGRLTRGNASTNSLGLEYKDHILNCVPDSGSVVRFKPYLFLTCRVEGQITRLHGDRKVADRKPTMIVSNVVPLEEDDQQSLW